MIRFGLGLCVSKHFRAATAFQSTIDGLALALDMRGFRHVSRDLENSPQMPDVKDISPMPRGQIEG